VVGSRLSAGVGSSSSKACRFPIIENIITSRAQVAGKKSNESGGHEGHLLVGKKGEGGKNSPENWAAPRSRLFLFFGRERSPARLAVVEGHIWSMVSKVWGGRGRRVQIRERAAAHDCRENLAPSLFASALRDLSGLGRIGFLEEGGRTKKSQMLPSVSFKGGS